MQQLAGNTIWQPRLWGLLLGSFSTIALFLAIAGIYGPLSYMVSQRRRDIGIRMALAAQSGAILGMVLKHGLTLAISGVVLGLCASFAVSRVLSKLLYDISPAAPLMFTLLPLLLLSAAAAASFVPAWRATKISPVILLKQD